MINDTDEKFQELCDAVQTEAALREKIKEQASTIAIALAYIRAEQPELAAIVLERAKL